MSSLLHYLIERAHTVLKRNLYPYVFRSHTAFGKAISNGRECQLGNIVFFGKMGENDLLDASTTLRTWDGTAWVDYVYGELVDADWNNITDAEGNKVIGWGQDPDGMMAAFQLAEPKILRPGEGFLATASGGTTGSAQMLFKNPFYVAE
jgi:hypothetical protein